MHEKNILKGDLCMKNYVAPKLVILSYDDEVLTADVVSASPLTADHEKTDGFNDGWLS